MTVVHGAARLLALFGGAVSALFIIYAGIQWMTAAGDPQKMAQARTGLIGTVVGIVIVGIGFLVPGLISEFVIEPAGGLAIEVDSGFDCDGALKGQLVVQRGASTASGMNLLINQIQTRQDECRSSLWHPAVADPTGWSDPPGWCTDLDSGGLASDPVSIGGMEVPGSLRETNTKPRESSGRDSRNNILVFWDDRSGVSNDNLPSDGANCWLYVSVFNTWKEGYRNR